MSKADDLKSHVPEAISQLKEFTELYNTQGVELDTIYYAVNDVVNQCFVNTATWGLTEWERFLALAIDESLQYELRRAKILAKLNQNMQVTPEQMAIIASSASGLEAYVVENVADYTFRVELVSQGKYLNIQVVLDAINEAKPAHLDYEIGIDYPSIVAIKSVELINVPSELVYCGEFMCGAYPESNDANQYPAGFQIAVSYSTALQTYPVCGVLICGEGVT